MKAFKLLTWVAAVSVPIGHLTSSAVIESKEVIGPECAAKFFGAWPLAKTGTRGAAKNEANSQLPVTSAVASGRSFGTEREGFEPSVDLRPHRFSRPARSATPAPLLSLYPSRTYG